MKVVYITAHAPFGRGETFVIEEMLAVAQQEVELLIVPRNPPKEIFHDEARRLFSQTMWLPLCSGRMLFVFLKALLLNPRLWGILGRIFRYSRTPKILLKNLIVTPKAVFVAGLLRKAGAGHIHAHWGSTTATMAWIAAELSRIPWSVTLHRWDIAEDNLLKLKAERAAFMRCISEDGRKELLSIIGETYQEKVKVLHMGVRVPVVLSPEIGPSRPDFVLACPANLVPVKGHRFLVEACELLIKKGIKNLRCLIVGDGPLEGEIRRQVAELELEEVIKFLGRLPHEQLMKLYEKREVDAVVLPSITTEDSEREGIPVALMEAMAYGIPVISTNTGGIPELLSEGAGIVVKEKDARELAAAIEGLLKDKNLAAETGKKGRQKVEEEFNLQRNVMLLLQNIKNGRREN